MSGVFIKTEDQLNLGETLLNITLSDNNTLALDNPDLNITCIRDNSVPDKDEWVFPIQVTQEITLNIGPERTSDLAFDGDNIWIAYNSHTANSELIKLDNNGNMLSSFPVDHEGGLTYGNGYLWAGDYDRIRKIDPTTGVILANFDLSGIPDFEPYLFQLAYEPGFIWVWSNNAHKLYKLTYTATTSIVMSCDRKKNTSQTYVDNR